VSEIVKNPTPRKKVPRIKDEIDYFKHQVEGIRRMLRMRSVLLADDMGLGKCIQALTVAACALEAECRRVLIVTPASLKGNWEEEIANYGKNFSCKILDGTPKQREVQMTKFSSDVLIVNYEQVIAHWAILNSMGFDITIYDEAHYLKNKSSARTKACFKLNQARHFLLTGSPVLNQVDDLWALLHRIDAGQFPNYWTFVNRYAVYGGYQDKQIIGIKNEKELRERMAPYLVRREKTECLDLPGKMIIPVMLDMHPEQRKLYDQITEDMELPNPADLENPFKIENALVKLMRLKEICGTTATLGYEDHSSKLDRAVDMAKQFVTKGESVVVFTQFRQVQACFATRLKKEGVDFELLHGDVKIADRQGVVKRWEANTKAKRPSILICMWQVGGIGMNFTASSTCFALDKLFVPKLNEQGYDRLDRIGQTKVVQVYEFIMRKSIEMRIEQICKRKTGIFGAIMDVDNSNWKKKLIESVKDDYEMEDSA
jgi:SNF2 family DNA or RNA helicase